MKKLSYRKIACLSFVALISYSLFLHCIVEIPGIIRLPKGLASRYWEEIILALIGNQFMGVHHDEICGAVLSVRYSEDILGVWNKHSADRDTVEKIRDNIKKILQLNNIQYMEYKPHQASLQDRSSFRNTQAWKPKPPQQQSQSQSQPESTSGPARRSGSWTERDKTKRVDGRASWRSGGKE
jgi:Eukaryotic initiation factor 4E